MVKAPVASAFAASPPVGKGKLLCGRGEGGGSRNFQTGSENALGNRLRRCPLIRYDAPSSILVHLLSIRIGQDIQTAARVMQTATADALPLQKGLALTKGRIAMDKTSYFIIGAAVGGVVAVT